jgi:3-oxoacyl-[acyl-carrier protein] reductase
MTSSDNKTLAGKVVLITGAVRRSGRATALELAKCGASIAINTRASIDEANAVKAEIEALGVKAGVYLCDVTDEAGVVSMVEAIGKELGPVDILINNAADRGRVPTLDLSLAEFRRIISIILEGAFLCSRSVLPHMVIMSAMRSASTSTRARAALRP